MLRNVEKMIVNTVLYSIFKFYSRINLRKMSVGQLLPLRKVEDLIRLYVKKKADIAFLNFQKILKFSKETS